MPEAWSREPSRAAAALAAGKPAAKPSAPTHDDRARFVSRG
jgi:hypothetical protein